MFPAVVPRPCWVPGCSSRNCAALPAPASGTSLMLGICYLLSLMLFNTFCSFFQGLGCSSVGLFLKYGILKLRFCNQQKLFAQHQCPNHQSSTHRAVCISVKYFVRVIRTSLSFQGGIRKPSRSANVWVLCCLRDELMQWHFKCNDLNTLSADCKMDKWSTLLFMLHCVMF